MKHLKMVTIFIAATLTLVLAGCGSSKDSSGSISGGDDVLANAQVLGVGNCATCHANYQQLRDWLESSTHGNNNDTPDFTFFGDPDPEYCEKCHNPNDEGDQIESVFSVIDPSQGNRPVIGCESCHGGGQFHNGILAGLPYPKPGPEQCVACHDGGGHGAPFEEPAVATKVVESRHNADDLHASQSYCERCHTYEGALEFSGYTGNYSVMRAMRGVVAAIPEEEVSAPSCKMCHIPHSEENFRQDDFVTINDTASGGNGDQDWDPNQNGTPDQFDFCTQCHSFYNWDGSAIIASGLNGTEQFYHYTAWYRSIPTTHYDDPATGYGLASNIQEGYVIREQGATPCFDCHGHELKTNTRQDETPPRAPTNHTDWAMSRHGAKLLEAKYDEEAEWIAGNRSDEHRTAAEAAAIMATGRIDGDGHGWSWTHYNWDQSSGTGNRAGCQRCHTATGVSNFLTDPTTYDPLNNDFSHLAGWTAGAGSTQNEMLYCWGCHDNVNNGTLRNPGAITETYDPLVTVVYPDINESNVCMACHLGRETGEVIKVDTDTDGTRSFINSHYLAAGASIFTESGYEYAGRDYANVSFYAHDQIGMGTDSDLAAWEAENGTPGPCVGCHMSSDQKHLFSNVEKDSNGNITAITTTVCASCHTGQFALTPAILNDEEHEYEASLDTLKAALTQAPVPIYTNFASYPYFFADAAFTASFTAWDSVYPGPMPAVDVNWKNTMGACFNLNLAGHDPGGFAHNRFYYKRLIWDSIDWIDDGIMNNSVPATINALETGAVIDAATATATRTYLGASRPGDPAP